MKLVSKLSPTDPFGGILEGQIADLAVFGGWAYLNSWKDPDCKRGGVYVVDIRKPRKPRQATFIPALAGNYHGEGAQVVNAKTEFFDGDLLAVNNEYCADVDRGGGFDLYDVSNPKKPKTLVQGFGDYGDEGTLTGDTTAAHDSHNVFVWQDDKKLYAASVDNAEQHDVDFFDITNPRAPKPIAEYDLDEMFPQIVDQSAFGDNIFNHDDVVKKVDGKWTMLASYWDGGYVKLDVSNPADIKYLGDTSFDGADPLTGLKPPEGNAHQVEFSGDDQYLLAADEDFSPFRAQVSVAGGEAINGAEATDTTTRIADLPGGQLGPSTTFVGQACTLTGGDTVPAAPADDADPNTEDIAVIVRGTCSFEEKVNAVKAQGWDGWIVYNNADRPDGDPLLTNGVVVSGSDLPGVFIRRQDALRGLFGITSGTDPAIGTKGKDVTVATVFDGWGYAHLYRNENGKMREVDSYAIPEALDRRFASGFGDLSIHEFAADPNERLAYSSYYSGGLRVFSFGEQGLKEAGAFIDEGGSNFWGVEFAHIAGKDYIATSDRDYGLYLFRY
ncbi:MAG: hypothetical protein H0V22_03645, partial [Solirubrobacterales bacterium]|nr:hypothetical protein [Solirubrobacterales bacterium]